MEEYRGLSEQQAKRLLAQYGENKLKAHKKTGAAQIFVGQFKDVMILILLASTVLSVLMGETTEALTIIAIVLLNAVLGFIQEFKTERTLERLGELAAPTARVIRDGQVQQLEARLIVPGDVVQLEAGDRIPADGVILSSNGLMCDESMLSGESDNVEKAPPRSAADKNGRVYMGTLATKGKAVCRIDATGADTEMGKIAGMLGSIETGTTPLQKRLAQLGKYIGIGCLLICAVVAATGILRGEPVFDMILTGISLSVAAVPEGLPAIVTIALALSVGRMVKRNALIRRLPAVETLGCANVICSDKTGTLTENRMTVKLVRTYDNTLTVTGNGLERAGEFQSGGHKIDPTADTAVNMLLDIAVVCNNASLSKRKAGFGGLRGLRAAFEVVGEPTEAALLVMAAKAGLTREKLGFRVEREIPFDSTRKMMSVIAARQSGERFLLCKGAPDILLSKCNRCLTRGGVKPLSPFMKQTILSYNNQMASDALRVLGFAYLPAPGGAGVQESGMIFVGLCGLLDPPRREAFDAVKKCRRAGIKPVMITGDHAVTARAIAQQLEIWREGDLIVTGQELDGMDDDRLAQELSRISVFARVTPTHKLRIVRAFKAQGNIVAMTGDGVNDAPAVKEADIGVSMGLTGTDVTKEAASVILLDDNFATLVAAVEEGRVIYQNIRKFIRYLLSCNIGEVVTMFFAMLMGMPIPLLPIQILLINLATDGLPAVALGLEPPQKNVMDRPPRGANESVFSHGLAGTIILRGLLIGITTLAVFVSLLNSSGDLIVARSGALLTLVATQLIHVFECKSEEKGLFSINPFDNPMLVLAVAVSAVMMYFTLYNPFFSSVFLTVALTGKQLLTVACYCAAVPLVSGIVLSLRQRRQRRQGAAPYTRKD